MRTRLNLDNTVTSSLNTIYDVRVIMDGARIEVWRAERGVSVYEKILETGNVSITSGNRFRVCAASGATIRYDDIRLSLSNLENVYTYSYNAANELTRMVDPWYSYHGFTYDTFGRLITKRLSEHDEDNFYAYYTYGYGGMLTEVDTDIPGESDVTYAYGGDGMRRTRTSGGVTTKYNYGKGKNATSEEDADGNLTTVFIGSFADILGSNSSNGSYRYYLQDYLWSVRGSLDESKILNSIIEYTPYGELLFNSGINSNDLFSGKPFDRATNMYRYTYRMLSPTFARWITRDPMGFKDGINPYLYVHGNPTTYIDHFGLLGCLGLPSSVAGTLSALEFGVMVVGSIEIGESTLIAQVAGAISAVTPIPYNVGFYGIYGIGVIAFAIGVQQMVVCGQEIVENYDTETDREKLMKEFGDGLDGGNRTR